MLDDLPPFPAQSIPSTEILCNTIFGGHSSRSWSSPALVETVPPVVVLHIVVGIDVDAIVHLGFIAQLGRHCLKTWTSSKACCSRCVRPEAKSAHCVVCCASTVAQAKVVVGSVVA